MPFCAALFCLLLASARAGAASASVFSPIPERPGVTITNAILLITPKALDFGLVPVGRSATNTFLVENVGLAKVVGRASVPPPFKIVSGESYTLTGKEVQVVTVVYTPTKEGTNTAVVTFTGGGIAKPAVSGRGLAN